MSSSESGSDSDSSSDDITDFHDENDSDIAPQKDSTDSDMPLVGYVTRTRTTVESGGAPIMWQKCDNFPRRWGFQGPTGVQDNTLDAHSTPRDIFLKFISPELMAHIRDETNNFAASHQKVQNGHVREWFPTTIDELYVFLSLVILMGLQPKPSMRLYWSRDPLFQTPIFSDTIPRDRFEQLLQTIRFTSIQEDENDRLFKLRPVIDHLSTKYRELYLPDQYLAVDESLWKFKGRLSFKQYIPAKRSRFGIKVFKVCQSGGAAAGYTYKFIIYTGGKRGDTPISQSVVLDLMHNLTDRGHVLGLDNWFSSPLLYLKLHASKTNVVGTVRLNRKGMPDDLNKKMKKGEIEYRSSDNGLLALVWMDKKPVKMLSTMHSHATSDTGKKDHEGNKIFKPECVQTYNIAKTGVDFSDQMATSHNCVRKSVKWYRKLFFYLIDMTLVNSFAVHRKLGGDTNYLEFRRNFIASTIETCELPVYRSRGRPSSTPKPSRFVPAQYRHFPVLIPNDTSRKKKYRKCNLCRSNTCFICEKCDNKPLCAAPCWSEYHSK